MSNRGLRVLVSGASVSGLSVAYWLARRGFEVTVVERAPQLRPGGQAVDVRGPALEVAARMGVIGRLRAQSTQLTGMSIVDAGGKEIFRSTERTLTGGRFDSPDIEILRDDLCAILHQTVGDGVRYLFGDWVVSFAQDEAGVDVVFAAAPPCRFDLVIGADGLRSGTRRLAFGPDADFIRYLGSYIAVFAAPNFLDLHRWQVFYQAGSVLGGVLVLDRDTPARTYLAFGAAAPLDYDYRDTTAQKQLIADRVAGAGWECARLVQYMWDAPDFYFDSMNQIRMNRWSRGRVVLLGDAGYSVSPATGQGTTVAMVAAYVLAGELAAHKENLLAGIGRYESELRDYVIQNQELAASVGYGPQAMFDEAMAAEPVEHPDGVPDFGQIVQDFALKNY